MTTRRWLFVVAVFGLILFGVMTASRSAYRFMIADMHAQQADAYERDMLALKHGLNRKSMSPELTDKWIAYGEAQTAYHASLREKYLKGGRRAWEALAPDPPPPPGP
jgi:hypothetical protein